MKYKFLIISILAFFSIQLNSQNLLENALIKKFPENPTGNGRWVYYVDKTKKAKKANIEKIEKPLVKEVLSNYEFYKVKLTGYLGGWDIFETNCLILFDSLKQEIVLVPPIWFDDVDENLIKLILNKQFDSHEKLLNFLTELNELMGEIDSEYTKNKFIYTGTKENIITYNLFEHNLFTDKCRFWREIEIKIMELKIVEYISINSALKDNTEYEKHYKKIIK